jgi:hypothetical protein
MDKLAKFKSSINVSNLIICFAGLYLFVSYSMMHYSYEIVNVIMYCSSVFLLYAILHYQVNSFYIFEDRIEVHYFFRLLNRVTIHKFDEISSVRYINSDSRYTSPTIQLIFPKMKRNTVLPSNSFPVRSFKKRKAILKFIDSKGIPIEIKSNFERDEDILV